MKYIARFQKQIAILVAVVLVLSVCLTAVPRTQAAEDSVITVWLNPSVASPFHNGEFQGWGTSLCWWANRVGYSETLTQQAATAFFSEDGLGLDIARYNIGGGDDPSHIHINRTDSSVPGVWSTFQYTNKKQDVSITYDISKDQNQLNVAKAALAANPQLYFEGFSNSAPYFMTNSGCTSGANSATDDNLKSTMYDDFARYIAEATKLFADEGIVFQSYSPMNEPDTNYWYANNTKQEGCHFSPGNSQSNLLVETRKALDDAGLNDVLVAGMDETSIDLSVSNLDQLTTEGLDSLGRIDTHTYGGSQRAELKQKAISLGKDLWMSEVDGSFQAGSGDMVGALGLAQRIVLDINEMQPAAWVLWNIIDIHQDADAQAPNGDYPDNGGSWYNPNSAMWGMSMANHDTGELVLSQKYYGYGQFTRYINPGDTIIASSNNTLAAYNKQSGDIKIVAINDTDSAAQYQFDLSSFTSVGTEVTVIRTSGSYETGEHWAEIPDGASLDGKKLTTTLKENSITTYIIHGTGPVETVVAEENLSGLYSIRSAVDGNYAIDISEASTENGANVLLWRADEARNQLFWIQSDGNGYYTIRSLHSGKCLDVSAWGTDDGTNVLQYTASDSDNQKWSITRNADGTYTFISKHSGKALDLNEGKTTNGQNIQIWTGNGGNSQRWSLKPYTGIDEGVYKLRLKDTQYALNVSGNSMTAGANVQLWDGSSDDGNLWALRITTDGYYSLRAIHSNMYLNVSGWKTDVIQWDDETVAENERWLAVPNADGSWCFVSQCNGLALTIGQETAANGVDVHVADPDYSETQCWVLEAGSNHEHTYTVTTTAPTCTRQGFTSYTCTTCGVVYTDQYVDALGHRDEDADGVCDGCEQLMGAYFYACSLTLNGNIGVNYYMEMSDDILNDTDNQYFMTFTVNGRTTQSPLDPNSYRLVDGTTYYRFTCETTSKEMNDTITAHFCRQAADGTLIQSSADYTYSVATYANIVIQTGGGIYGEQLVNLVKAMLNYGGCAQVYFGHTGDNGYAHDGLDFTMAEPDLSSADYNCQIAGSVTGLSYYGSSLLLNSETSLRFYFTPEAGCSIDDYTFTVSGTELTAVPKGNLYYVEVPNISASQLANMFTLTVTHPNGDAPETLSVTYGPMTYVRDVLAASTTSDALKDVVKALYHYYAGYLAWRQSQ